MEKPDLSIVLPCYNESGNIPAIVERLGKLRGEVGFELIMVNNGSTDGTEGVLRALSRDNAFLRVVTVEKNIGYGHGILTGLKAARADVVAYSHADIQTPPEDVIKAYRILKDEGYDVEKVVIKGLRVNRRKEDLFLTRSLARVVEMALGRKMEDINGQPKLFSRSLIPRLESSPTDFSFDVYVMYAAGLMGLKLITFPVDFGTRMHGESKWAASILGRYKTILKYLFSIAKMAMARRRALKKP